MIVVLELDPNTILPHIDFHFCPFQSKKMSDEEELDKETIGRKVRQQIFFFKKISSHFMILIFSYVCWKWC